MFALRSMCRTVPHLRMGHGKILLQRCKSRLPVIGQAFMMKQSVNKTSRRRKSPVAVSGVNDFVVKFANINGTGSSSANLMFAKAVFRMGIPVSPRNIFPSNIQGLPTWYEVRVSEKGYLARRGGGVDLMVGVNPQSMAKDVAEVITGG